VTAAAAELSIVALVDGRVPPGVWGAEQVLEPLSYLAALAREGFAAHVILDEEPAQEHL
jgi:hypothetical protein